VAHRAPATDFGRTSRTRASSPRNARRCGSRTTVPRSYVGRAMYDDSGRAATHAAGAARRRSQLRLRPVIFDTYHDHMVVSFPRESVGCENDANGLGGGATTRGIPCGRSRRRSIRSAGPRNADPFCAAALSLDHRGANLGPPDLRQENRLNELSQWAFWGCRSREGAAVRTPAGLVIKSAPGARGAPYVVGGRPMRRATPPIRSMTRTCSTAAWASTPGCC